MAKRKTTARKPASKLTTVKLNTSMRAVKPFPKLEDGEFVDRLAAEDGDTVKLEAAHADRMIAKGRAVKV